MRNKKFVVPITVVFSGYMILVIGGLVAEAINLKSLEDLDERGCYKAITLWPFAGTYDKDNKLEKIELVHFDVGDTCFIPQHDIHRIVKHVNERYTMLFVTIGLNLFFSGVYGYVVVYCNLEKRTKKQFIESVKRLPE